MLRGPRAVPARSGSDGSQSSFHFGRLGASLGAAGRDGSRSGPELSAPLPRTRKPSAACLIRHHWQKGARRMKTLTCFGLVLLGSNYPLHAQNKAAAPAATVFQIGVADGDYQEFALEGMNLRRLPGRRAPVPARKSWTCISGTMSSTSPCPTWSKRPRSNWRSQWAAKR